MGALEQLTDNQRSWMSAVASVTGGSTFELDGRFAGHAWLHVAAGAGGLFDVFVAEGNRRRGLGSALSRAGSAKAAGLGIETITLNAEFEPLYDSLGSSSLGRRSDVVAAQSVTPVFAGIGGRADPSGC